MAALSEWKEKGRALLVSSITLAELLSYREINEKESLVIKGFLKNFVSVPFDDNLAEVAAGFRRSYNLEIPDAAIAATAFAYKLLLVTRDKQFARIKELTVFAI